MSLSYSGNISISSPGSGLPAGPAADLIVTRATAWTGETGQPEAEAVAVLGDRIVAVGSAAEVAVWRGRRTRVIDADGKLLLPGFNDAHVHFIDGGLQLDNVDLKDASSPEEFVRRVAAQAKAVAHGDWLLGGGWDEQQWDQPVLPTKQMIDPVTSGMPILLHRCDIHTALANSAALRLAGVTAGTPDPAGGVVVRDTEGEPTGILKNGAIGYVARVMPPLTYDRRLRALKRALQHAASLGVTSVQHMCPASADIALYMELAERGELTTRIYAAPLETEWARQGMTAIRHGFGSSLLRLGALKGFTDGSLGSATACFFEPYIDIPETSGLLTDEMHPHDALRERLLRADAAGMQLCWHAIGDRAVSLTLDLLEEIIHAHGACDRRFRIEHAQHVRPEDIVRFAPLGAIASVQPYHAIDDGCWAERRIGKVRLQSSYPYRTLLDHDVRLALGTDWCVAPLNPMLTLYAATTMATLDGKHPEGWLPGQKLSMADAVSAYTRGSAYAEFQENEKGSIAPGKLADMVLVSDNIFRMAPEQVRETTIEITIAGGRVVYEATH
jgi:predicted amidohydrolase YtcJ